MYSSALFSSFHGHAPPPLHPSAETTLHFARFTHADNTNTTIIIAGIAGLTKYIYIFRIYIPKEKKNIYIKYIYKYLVYICLIYVIYVTRNTVRIDHWLLYKSAAHRKREKRGGQQEERNVKHTAKKLPLEKKIF
ncbi:hypothetical protein P5V15_007953 [Pogonomyrmex californicus]